MLRLNHTRVTPVVHLDRIDKARMIERVVEAHCGHTMRDWKILDIGCGNGDISQYFTHDNQPSGVDVSDKRKPANKDFEFIKVDSEELPFHSSSFDLVISNHVIEHVNDQHRHLAEIHRVLKPGGLVYMATPNKRSPFMKGHIGNERVLRYEQMEALFCMHGFKVREYTISMIHEPDKYGVKVRVGRWLPIFILHAVRAWIPSNSFILVRS